METDNFLEPMRTVRSLDLMNWLCQRGFVVKKVKDSDKNPQFKVFLYDDTKEIRAAIGYYMDEKTKTNRRR